MIRAFASPRRSFISQLLLAVLSAVLGFLLAIIVIHAGPTLPPATNHNEAVGLRDAAKGNCTQAIPLLAAISSQDPANVTASEALGNCYAQVGAYTQALHVLSASARLDGTYRGAYLYAQAACKASQTSLCRTELQKTINKTRNPVTLIQVAMTAEGYSLSNQAFHALLDVPANHRNYLWYYTLARTDDLIGQTSAAIRASREAVLLAPQSEHGVELAELGNIYIAAGQFSNAISALTSAISTGQVSTGPVSTGPVSAGQLYRQIADCQLALGTYKGVLATTDVAMHNSLSVSDYYSLLYTRALAYTNLGEIQKARSALSQITAAPYAPANLRSAATGLLSALP